MQVKDMPYINNLVGMETSGKGFWITDNVPI